MLLHAGMVSAISSWLRNGTKSLYEARHHAKRRGAGLLLVIYRKIYRQRSVFSRSGLRRRTLYAIIYM